MKVSWWLWLSFPAPCQSSSYWSQCFSSGLQYWAVGVWPQLDVAEEDTEEVPNIPGLDWNQDSPFFKQIAADRMPVKKIPFARPIPRSFEKAWLGQEPPQTSVDKGCALILDKNGMAMLLKLKEHLCQGPWPCFRVRMAHSTLIIVFFNLFYLMKWKHCMIVKCQSHHALLQ